MAEQIQPIRGMNDILPTEIGAWQYLERAVRDVVSAYGYEEMRVPIVEQTSLFKRSIGEFTDVVGKEMYSFESQGGENLTLANVEFLTFSDKTEQVLFETVGGLPMTPLSKAPSLANWPGLVPAGGLGTCWMSGRARMASRRSSPQLCASAASADAT